MRIFPVYVLLVSCSSAEWAAYGKDVLARDRNMCQLAAYSDAIVMGRIVAVNQNPQVRAFSVWRGTRLKMTEFTLLAERDLKSTVAMNSTLSVLVSAPVAANGRAISTLSASPVDELGWFGLTKLDGVWTMSVGGMIRDRTDGGSYVTELGDYESEAAFEAALARAISLCPRIDLFGDGGIPDGGYAVWEAEYLEARERALLDAGRWDGGP